MCCMSLPWFRFAGEWSEPRVTPVGCKVAIDWRVIPIWLQAALSQTCDSDPRLSGARSPQNLSHFPHGSQSKARFISSSIASAAAEAARTHSVATFGVATECRTSPPAGDATSCWSRRRRVQHRRRGNTSCA